MPAAFARPRIWRAVTGRWICHLVVGRHVYVGAGATPAQAWRAYCADIGPRPWIPPGVSREGAARETAPA
jgi:hypothetical protein